MIRRRRHRRLAGWRGQAQRRYSPDGLAPHPQRFPAGRDDADHRAACDQVANQVGDRVDDVLARIKNQQ